MIRSLAIRTISLLVMSICLVASWRGPLLTWGVLHPDVAAIDPTRKFDAIVVLSGERRRIELGYDLAEAGRAPTLVVIFGEKWESVLRHCGTDTSFETICPVPEPDSTRGEAQLVASLAMQRNWRSVLIVTGNYHFNRAKLLIERCVGNDVTVEFQLVDWKEVPKMVLRNEVLKTALATLGEGDC